MEQTGIPDLQYIWIVRCSGHECNRNIEYKIARDITPSHVFPLVEVIDFVSADQFASTVHQRFHNFMFEYPAYLKEQKNKFQTVTPYSSIHRFDNCVNFFSRINLNGIPIISSSQNPGNILVNYTNETSYLRQVKPSYNQVGVRIRIPSYDLKDTTTLDQFNALINELSNRDILLLDIFALSRPIKHTYSNLGRLSRITAERGISTYVLNGFEPEDMEHNYGPIFSMTYNLNGFGDFATEKRFPTGGQPPNRTVRKKILYFNPRDLKMYEFKDYEYDIAVRDLKSSPLWTNNGTHRGVCPACTRVHNGQTNDSRSYWKDYRIRHYISSIVNDVRERYRRAATPEDFDPDGYQILFNTGSG